jgi:nitrate/nitrite-specific signal transduction histidine kinase
VNIGTFSPGLLRRLVEGSAAVASQTDLQTLLTITVETAVELTGARYGALGVLGEHGRVVQFVHVGFDPDTVEAIGTPPQGLGVLGLISRQGRTLRIDEVSEHPDSAGFPEGHPIMDTFLGVPVRAGDDLFGNLYLTCKEGGFTDEDEAVTEAVAIIAGAAVRSVRLQARLLRLAVVEEKERIARDLHDGIIQDLFAVGLSLQGQRLRVNEADVRAALERDVESLDNTISTLRSFIFGLNRPSGPRRTIQGEVRELITRLAGPHDVEVHVAYTGALDAIPPDTIDDTVQLLRESVSNSLRHAGAEQIIVEIHGSPDSLSIAVIDDGDGFDVEGTTEGLGLANLRSRTARARGRFEIESTIGSGTSVRMSLPL